MPIELSEADRADLARLVQNSAGGIHETIARHFVAVGLDRGAASCGELARVTRNESKDDGSEAMAKAFDLAASAIRALK